MTSCAWEAFYSASQLRRWQEAIDRRFSCRSFRAPADMAAQGALHYFAGRSQLPGVRIAFSTCDPARLFRAIPFVGGIEYATQYAAIIYDAAEPMARLHAGIAGEALQLEMVDLQLASCWISGSYRRKAVDIPLQSGEKLAALMPYGQPQDPEGASHRRRRPLTALCLDDPADWPLWAYQAAEAVRAAPSALNAQPWRFSHSGSTLRLSGRRFGGVDHGIAVLHALCALRQTPHRWRISADGKALLITIEEQDDTI